RAIRRVLRDARPTARPPTVTIDCESWRSFSAPVLGSAQQPDVELAAREQHIVQCFADVARFDPCAAIASDAGLRDAPHQFLDEGSADALCASRGLDDDGLVERQVSAIELDELAATDLVRQRQLDRLVDAAGPARQGAFELF